MYLFALLPNNLSNNTFFYIDNTPKISHDTGMYLYHLKLPSVYYFQLNGNFEVIQHINSFTFKISLD